MDWADYLRDEAAKYRQLAETAKDLSIKQELLDLAAVCEEAANKIEDRMPGGSLAMANCGLWTYGQSPYPPARSDLPAVPRTLEPEKLVDAKHFCCCEQIR